MAEPLWDIDRVTGELIRGWERCKQSILTILTTRLRTRIMRLWWGSSFLDMQDRPSGNEAVLYGIVAAVEAVNAYEPEFQVTSVTIEALGAEGSISVVMNGDYLPEKTARRFQDVI